MKIELFFKSSIQLGAVLDLILQRPKLASHFNFNIPNKVRDENLLPFAEQIRNSIPNAHVCLHYSLKNNRAKGLSDASNKFVHFISRADACGVGEILLVSGSGDKRHVNSLTCLQSLKQNQFILPPSIQIGVAFNPYYSDLVEYGKEKQRLIEKLNTGYVSLVYLQFGSNIEMLQQSLEWIHEQRRANVISPSIRLYGSVFLPSKQLIARMKFRPWKGLILTDEFLSDCSVAEEIVQEIILLYKNYNIDIIIETAFRTSKEAEKMEELLQLQEHTK